MTTFNKPFLIGVAGGTCCGKSEVCKKISHEINEDNENQRNRVIVLGHRHFYRALSEEEQKFALEGNYNFDHPNAFDDDLAFKSVKTLKEGNPVTIPKYNFTTHSHDDVSETIFPAEVILLEGILVLYNKDIRDLLDMKIFVDTDCDTRLARRVLRDTVEHKRDIDSVLKQYTKFIKRSFEDFTLPTKKYADVIIPRGVDNTVAINLIVEHLRDILKVESRVGTHIRKSSEGSRPH